MQNYKYLIIGGGMTGDAVVKGIRERDTQSSIGMIGSETDLPYGRPPLTKGMWKGRPLEKIWRGTDKQNVEFHLGRTVTRIDPAAKRVQDLEGEEYGYEKLMLATGATPNRLPFGGEDIIYYRTLKNYLRLRVLAEQKKNFVVIGAGFIGSEIAAALTMFGKQVTLVFRGNSIGEQVYPPDLSSFLTDHYRSKGVQLVPADEVIALDKSGESFMVHTKAGLALQADGVVAGLGVHPNTDLAKAAGLQVDDGILVNDRLQTSATDIYAAGDVARFPHYTLKKLVRVEHEDNAIKMGKQAGRNMAGADEAYAYTPNFYSDLFEFGYEAVGELKRSLETVEDWQPDPGKKGTVYYLEGGKVRGVLMWNIRDKIKDAAALMAEAGPFKPEDLKGRIS